MKSNQLFLALLACLTLAVSACAPQAAAAPLPTQPPATLAPAAVPAATEAPTTAAPASGGNAYGPATQAPAAAAQSAAAVVDVANSAQLGSVLVDGNGMTLYLFTKDSPGKAGRAITDDEAKGWMEKVLSFNPRWVLFLKHWLIEKMPSSYRTGIVFVDDSQELGSLDAMLEEFAGWGEAFAPAEVGFQVGYEADQTWWSGLADPPGDIGRALLERIPNMTDLYWVDFTAYTLWPPR
jgi:hypothetical protein